MRATYERRSADSTLVDCIARGRLLLPTEYAAMAALPWRPAIVLLRVLVAVVGVYTNSSPPPSTAISRCYANGADSPTNTNPKVLAVGGRVGSHVDLIVFMRSDGSVVSCACVWHML